MDVDVDRCVRAHAETAVAAPALDLVPGRGRHPQRVNPGSTCCRTRTRPRRRCGCGTAAERGATRETYTLGANSRTNIWVDLRAVPGLAWHRQHRRVGRLDVLTASPSSWSAMYLDAAARTFAAGARERGRHGPAAREWFPGGGATASTFDLFVLVTDPARPTRRWRRPICCRRDAGGQGVTPWRATARFNILVDYEDAQLARRRGNRPPSARQRRAVIVEGRCGWPGVGGSRPTTPRSDDDGDEWAVAEGEVDAARTWRPTCWWRNVGDARRCAGDVCSRTGRARRGRSRHSRAEPVQRAGGGVSSRQSVGSGSGRSWRAWARHRRRSSWNGRCTGRSGPAWAAGTNALATKLQ